MIPDNLIIFIILLVLIYCLEDSFFGLFILFIVSMVEVYTSASAVSSEQDVRYVFLFVLAVLYSFGSLLQWVSNDKKRKKAERLASGIE